MTRRTALVIAALALALAGCASGGTGTGGGDGTSGFVAGDGSTVILDPAARAAAPAVAGTTLDGAKLDLASLRGKVVVVNFWASWCAPCREEHPVLVAAARQQQVPIIGMNYKDDPRNAQEWLLRLGDPYQVSLADRDGRAAIDDGVYGVPETFVIDKAGVVRLKHVGPLTTEVWQRELLPLIQRLKG